MDDQQTTADAAVEAAHGARQHAYVPYSKFAMGAAVETDAGTIVPGALVENVSLGLAMCAERVALFASVAQQAGRPARLVLSAPRTDGRITFPCGACLQVALELGGRDLRVVAVTPEGDSDERALGELLPLGPEKD